MLIDEFVISHSQLRSRPSASKFELDNLRAWMNDYKGAICADEAKIFDETEDLIPIQAKSKTLLRNLIERSGHLIGSSLFSRTPESETAREIDPDIKFFSDELVERYVYIAIVMLGLGMLIGPLWWLNVDVDPTHRLGIITAFVILFTGLMGGATNAKPFEAMAATAA